MRDEHRNHRVKRRGTKPRFVSATPSSAEKGSEVGQYRFDRDGIGFDITL